MICSASSPGYWDGILECLSELLCDPGLHQKTKYFSHTLTSNETAFVSLSERRLACYIVLGLTALALADNDTTVLLLESRLLQPGGYTCCADLHATRGHDELGWLDKF